uniref:Uncharacterized protein n=1 Tax=Anguilla anguilla TaxID=7936 RepID=A0A0E9S3N1_ANGAN
MLLHVCHEIPKLFVTALLSVAKCNSLVHYLFVF